LAGLAISAYLTYAHYTTAKVLACSDAGFVNCAAVTTSSYSQIFGVPVSDTGLAYFLVMAALCSSPAWRSNFWIVRASRVAFASLGAAMVVWLVYAELYRLRAICLYCSLIHLTAVALFITVALGTASIEPVIPSRRTTGPRSSRRG
jgi:uncharacterized membrane protein